MNPSGEQFFDRLAHEPVKRVCCIGAGYVGGPTCAVIAANCPDVIVTVVDADESRIRAWNSENLPIYEPGLQPLVEKVRGRNLFFTTDIATEVEAAELIFISVNTPTKTFGEGKGKAANLENLENVSRLIARLARTSKIVVEKSTVPVRAAEIIGKILSQNRTDGVHFEVLSNPEFMAEGTAVSDLEKPDRILIGSGHSKTALVACEKLQQIYRNWVPAQRILATNTWSSELSKLVANALLAQRISSINAVSLLCEATGANVSEVALAVGADHRIGGHFLKPSIGFGGSCFQKDILNIVYISEVLNLPEVASYFHQIVLMNDFQKRRFAMRIVECMFSNVVGKRIAILGFAFKADTGDTRETAAIYVCKHLLEEGAVLAVYDPKVSKEQIHCDLGLDQSDPRLQCVSSVEEAALEAHALVICTEWAEFKKLNYQQLYEGMAKPAFLFDGRLVVPADELAAIGFHVEQIGRQSNHPKISF